MTRTMTLVTLLLMIALPSLGDAPPATQPASDQADPPDKPGPLNEKKATVAWHYRSAMQAIGPTEQQRQDLEKVLAAHHQANRQEIQHRREMLEDLHKRLAQMSDEPMEKRLPLMREIDQLMSDERHSQERRFIEEQRDVMPHLTPVQKRNWPALVLAGQAMERYRHVLTDDQVDSVNEMCLERRDKLARIRDFGEKYAIQHEIQKKIYQDILTPDQRKQYHQQQRQKLGKPRHARKNNAPGKNSAPQPAAEKQPQPETPTEPRQRSEGAGGW